MSELVPVRHGQIAVSGPPGSRALGVRVKPALRLAIGYRDEAKRGAPVKVDHFIAKEGAEGQYARAAAKFNEVYPAPCRAVDVRLPAELHQALDIRYKAFAGGSGETGEGGVMTAKGETNFGVLEWVGGPDILTVWHQDGTVEEVETAGVDAITGEPLDEVADGLQLALYTTFRFGIPAVLAYGSFCEVVSKGKETTDTLWLKLRGLYGTFGPRTSFVVRPKLIVKPSSARPIIHKRGEEPRRIKTRIYVLDVLAPETEDEMIARLREYAELTSAAAAQMWGPANGAALGAGVTVVDQDEPSVPSPEGSVQQAGAGVTPLAPVPAADDEEPAEQVEAELVDGDIDETPEPEPEPAVAPEAEPELVDPLALTANEQKLLPKAEAFKIPLGSYQGRTLAKILEFGESGEKWIGWALRQPWPKDANFRAALAIFAKAHTPDTYAAWAREEKA